MSIDIKSESVNSWRREIYLLDWKNKFTNSISVFRAKFSVNREYNLFLISISEID